MAKSLEWKKKNNLTSSSLELRFKELFYIKLLQTLTYKGLQSINALSSSIKNPFSPICNPHQDKPFGTIF